MVRVLLDVLGLSALVAVGTALSNQRSVPEGWTIVRRADPDIVLPVKIALAQSNLHNLDAYLLDVADPLSPNYAQHWSPARVAETFRPSEESVNTVLSWLVAEGGFDQWRIKLTQDGGALVLNVTIAQAERVFATEYNVYSWDGDGRERIGCHNGHNIPGHVSSHVDFIWSTLPLRGNTLPRRDSSVASGFRRPQGVSKVFVEESIIPSGVEHCDEAVTLQCLRALYKFDYKLLAPHKNKVSIAEFGQNVYQQSDLDTFFHKFEPSLVGHQPTLVSIAGGHLNASDTDPRDLGESSLDFELLMGLLGPKQEVILYQVGTDAQDPFLGDKLLGAFDASYCALENVSQIGLKDCGNKPRPNVISISYGSYPDVQDPEIVPILQRQCVEIGKLSLTGMTAIASSGDSGVSSDGICGVNGTLVDGNQPGSFVPQFPASCPYVTTVGSTSVSPGKSVHDAETATTAFPSGGGFSNTFSRLSFQESAVNNYLKYFAPQYEPGVFNMTGRAYPDVSANGWPLVIAVVGQFVLSGGTSASAPIFASIIAAVNDARIAAGKHPVGWINPALYSHSFAHAFNDVTNGTNPGCGTEGFRAAPGWDPVTGLGTPNFDRLLASFLALQ